MSTWLVKGLLLMLIGLVGSAMAGPAYGYTAERTGRSYTDIARVINPNPYAHVGARNYPAQPFWHAGR